MNLMKRFGALSFAIIFIWSCAEKKGPNKFSDPVLVLITDYQDSRRPDSLYQFFKSENPIYRSATSLAFASLQDTASASALGNLLLQDPDVSVRRYAAFALGQTSGIAAVNALIAAVHDHDPIVVREVLEALGKTINGRDLESLKEFKAGDTLSQEGLAWGFYRLGLRNLADSTIIDRESEFLNSKYSYPTRLAAAHFFSRAKLTGVAFQKRLIDAALHDFSPEVRMAAVGGLKKIDAHQAIEVIKRIVLTDKDYRVRNNAVRACSGFSLKESQEIVFGALRDSSLAVQISASELLIQLVRVNPFKRIEEDIANLNK